jgi:hypothetical protein
MQTPPSRRQSPQSAWRRLTPIGVVACGVVSGLVELWALQRQRLAGRHGTVPGRR